ncbi:MAG: MBL fold metallo-hydrolase [Deltaproteobacteria bacterium]|nr:MBL fold metallo-hydrolase [Deltaproteobacteria bacterium]
MQENEQNLTKHLERRSLHTPTQEALHFVGLQRWNSLTPAQGRSVGGGYFIYRTNSEDEVDLGIAIDPGFDYVRNLFRMGFSLMDVDIVLISHAHPDHLWDFESVVQLLHELKGKKDIVHQLNVILTLGSYQRLDHIINNPKLRRFINPLVIDIRKEIDPDFFKKLGTNSKGFNDFFGFFDSNSLNNNSSRSNKEKVNQWSPALPYIEEHAQKTEIEIWPTRAYHDDYSDRSDSFGFIIKVKSLEHSDSSVSFGYTGDTKWVGNDLYNQACPADDNDCEKKCSVDSHRWEDVASQYTDCDVLLMHLGSIIDHKDKDENKQSFSYYDSAKNCEELIREKNHPYLMGMIRFLRKLYNTKPEKKKLILMGEFGEELRGGIRIDLVKRLQQGLTKTWPIVPVDVGLDIILHNYSDSEPKENSPQFSKFKFLCALCDKPRPLREIGYFRFGADEAIFYICKTCNRAFPDDVRQTRLRHLYEIGRELRTLPPNRAVHDL